MTTAVLSNYLENELVDHILRNAAYTSPGTSIYVSLYTTNPDEDDSGTEVTGGSYAREQVTAWDVPAAGATENTNAITFTQATASWGTVSHVGIHDAVTAGNLLFYGALSASKVVDNGDTFSIASGNLDIVLDGAWSTYLANEILDHVLRNLTYTTPGTSIYSALYTDNPTAGDIGTEVTGGAYARKQISTWDVPTNGATANTNLEAFTTASGANWGTVTYHGIRDASTAGNLLFFAALTASKTVNDGDTFQWPAGNLDVTLT